MEIRRISTDDCMPLRGLVLRPFHPVEDCRYPQDHRAVHFGVFGSGELLSIITAHPEDSRLFTRAGQWRIRGMATHPRVQGQGYGGEALEALLAWARRERLPLCWCNARERAIPFYLRHGFRIESELFEIAGIGPHKVLRVDL